MLLYTFPITLSALLFANLSLASPTLQKRATVSPNGSCGGTTGYTCQGSRFGDSCSRNNQCGNSKDYSYSKLSQGCQPAYGFCVAKGSVSPDGSCGGADGFICLGSNFGDSCGRYNLCGRDAGYSGDGCQPQYGYCAKCTTTVLPSTSTVTLFATATVVNNPTVTATATVSSGVTTTTTTTTTTPVVVSTLAVIVSSTTTAVQSVTPTVTLGTVMTVAGGTVITTITSGDAFLKKREAPTIFTAPSAVITPAAAFLPERKPLDDASSSSGTTQPTLSKRAPGDPAGLSCGTLISTGFTTVTATATSTVTAFVTRTSTATAFVTVPSSTSTVTQTSTTISSSVFTTTTTTVSTVPASLVTVTVASTAVTTAPAATVSVVQTRGTYRKVAENANPSRCTYRRYFSRTGGSTDPTNNYQTARNQCAAQCDASPTCVTFFFDRFDQGGAFTECLLDSQPYDPNQLNCNVTGQTLYYAAYNKV